VRDDLTGLVLAGGASRRMGGDKALLHVDGRPLVDHVALRLASVCTTVLVAPGPRLLPDLPWKQVDDHVAGEGPLSGIIGGLAAASTPLVAVVAVDMPHVDPAVLVSLADAWDGQPAVVPVVGGRTQPLHAVYAVAGLARLTTAFAAGDRSVSRVLPRVGALFVTVDDGGRWADDLDTPEDLGRFRRGGPG
jgi:molybdopterin-guanine dinucleotide biosynthesis protein A